MKQGLVKVTSVIVLIVLCTLFVAPQALALDRVIVNSGNWEDVYSGMLYASLKGVPSNFLVSTKHGSILLYSIPTTEKDLFVVTSRQQPYVVGYESLLKSKGYANTEELITREANLDLARRLTDVNKFIIVDPAYGYNAMSVAPYAVVSDHYVLFADRRNIDDVVKFLEEKNPDNLILFGQLDREVKDAMTAFDAETINKGDRFSNNLAMVDRYLAINPTKQTILTNGEFIEAGMMSGEDPVIFIGRANVPDVVREYVKNSDLDVGILIGNELIGTATFIRRQLGISVFVKFAQGARVPTGTIAQVEDLDRFPMPSYKHDLEITSLVYNRATRALEVTYHNPTGLAEYLKGTITLTINGENFVVGDTDAVFIDKNGYKTIVYTADTDGQQLFIPEDVESVSAHVFTIYGEGPRALEYAIEATLQVDFTKVLDDAQVNITGLYYDTSAKQFIVLLENTGAVDAYVQPEIVDLLVNGEYVTVASDETIFIRAGGKAKVPVSIELVDKDFEENPMVTVRAFYGEREISLVKMTERSFALEFGGGLPIGQIVVYTVVLLVILFLLFFLGTKKKCPNSECGHKNPRGRKTCERCGTKL